jgi:hypothetical protein
MGAPVLTGRRRYRIQKRVFRHPLLVLQLEVQGLRCRYAGFVDCEYERWWIDAGPEHITITGESK